MKRSIKYEMNTTSTKLYHTEHFYIFDANGNAIAHGKYKWQNRPWQAYDYQGAIRNAVRILNEQGLGDIVYKVNQAPVIDDALMAIEEWWDEKYSPKPTVETEPTDAIKVMGLQAERKVLEILLTAIAGPMRVDYIRRRNEPLFDEQTDHAYESISFGEGFGVKTYLSLDLMTYSDAMIGTLWLMDRTVGAKDPSSVMASMVIDLGLPNWVMHLTAFLETSVIPHVNSSITLKKEGNK